MVKKINDKQYVINGETMKWNDKEGQWILGKGDSECRLSFTTGFKLIQKNKK